MVCRLIRYIVFLLAFLQLHSVCFADMLDLFKNWKLNAGVYTLLRPEYEGSNKMKFFIYPLIVPVYRDFIVITLTDISCYFPVPGTEKKLIGGLLVGYDFFKMDNDNFGSYEKGVILSPMLIFNPNKYLTSVLTFRKAFGGSDGLSAELRFKAKYSPIEKLELNVDVFSVYGDRKYMDFRFGVNGEEVLNRSFSPYSPSASIKSAGGAVGIKYNIWRGLKAELLYTAEFLLNEASTSPTTQTKFVPKTVFMLYYAF